MQDKKYSTSLEEYLINRKNNLNTQHGFWSGIKRGAKAFGQQVGNTAETAASITGLGLEAANSGVGLAEGGLVVLISEATDLLLSPRSLKKSESSSLIADACLMKHIREMDEEEKSKKVFIDLGD